MSKESDKTELKKAVSDAIRYLEKSCYLNGEARLLEKLNEEDLTNEEIKEIFLQAKSKFEEQCQRKKKNSRKS